MIETVIHKGVLPEIPADVLDFALREFEAHYHEWGTDETLSFSGILGGEKGGVRMHTDFDFARDQCVWGLILLSEGPHELVVGDYLKIHPLFRGVLEVGDVYRLDPSIMHGTETREPEGRIIFAAMDRPIIGDTTTPAEAAAAIITYCRREIALRQRQRESAVEREARKDTAMTRGMQPGARPFVH